MEPGLKGKNRKAEKSASLSPSPNRTDRQSSTLLSSHWLHRPIITSFVIFLVAIIVRGLHLFLMRDSLTFSVLICDAWQYDRWGQEISSGNWLGTETFYQTPLYPYSLGLLYTIFGHNVWIVRIAQALMSSLACVFLSRAGSRYFSERVGLLAGLTLALYPPAIFFDGILQKASLDLFLMTGLLWALACCYPTPRPLPALSVGLLLGAFVLNRENAALLVPILGIGIPLTVRPLRSLQALKTLLLIGVGIAIFLVPVGLRNQYVGGEFLLTTSQMGPNFYIGNHRGAQGYYESLRPFRGDPRFERDDARLLAEENEGHALSPSEVSSYWMKRAKDDISSDPASWLKLMAWKTFLTFHSTEMVDAESERVHAKDSLVLAALLPVLHFGVLTPLAVLGLWITRRDARKLWTLYAILIAFAIAVIAFYVMGRYRYPLVPAMMLFAAAGVIGSWDLIRSGRRSMDIVVGGAVALGMALVSNWPAPHLLADKVTYLNIGNGLLDLNRQSDAIIAFKDAIKIDPNYTDAHNNLGNVYLAMGRKEEAEESYRKALAIDPKMTFALLNLGKTFEAQGKIDQAIAIIEKSLALDPLMADGHQTLGRIQCAHGDFAHGIPHLERAIYLNPRSPFVKGDLALAYIQQGKYREGIDLFRKIYEATPKSFEIGNNLAWFLATAPDDSARDGKEAVRVAKEVVKLTESKHPVPLDTLAAAYAETGDFDQAIKIMKDAVDKARALGDMKLVEKMNKRLTDYQEHRPYRDNTMLVKPRTK